MQPWDSNPQKRVTSGPGIKRHDIFHLGLPGLVRARHETIWRPGAVPLRVGSTLRQPQTCGRRSPQEEGAFGVCCYRREMNDTRSNQATPIERLVGPFQEFAKLEASGGVLLISCIAFALVWANSPWAASYSHLWHAKLTFGFAG